MNLKELLTTDNIANEEWWDFLTNNGLDCDEYVQHTLDEVNKHLKEKVNELKEKIKTLNYIDEIYEDEFINEIDNIFGDFEE